MLIGKNDILEGLNPLIMNGVNLPFADQVTRLRVLMDPASLLEKPVGVIYQLQLVYQLPPFPD